MAASSPNAPEVEFLADRKQERVGRRKGVGSLFMSRLRCLPSDFAGDSGADWGSA